MISRNQLQWNHGIQPVFHQLLLLACAITLQQNQLETPTILLKVPEHRRLSTMSSTFTRYSQALFSVSYTFYYCSFAVVAFIDHKELQSHHTLVQPLLLLVRNFVICLTHGCIYIYIYAYICSSSIALGSFSHMLLCAILLGSLGMYIIHGIFNRDHF